MHIGRLPLWWSLIYVILLLSSVTPFGLFTVSFILIPIIILYHLLDTYRFILHYFSSLIVAYVIMWMIGVADLGATVMAVAVFFLMPAVVLGHFYRKKASARATITMGIVTILLQLLFVLVGLSLIGINIVKQFREMLKESIQSMPGVWPSSLTQDMVQVAVQTMTQMLPLLLIAVSFYFIVIAHWISRKLLNRLGENIPGLKPVKTWMLPKSFVWYYLAALVLSYLFPAESNTIITTVLLNLVPLLMFVFAIQAVAFLTFLVDLKRWTKALPIAAFMLIFIFPLVVHFLALLGVVDVTFPLRDRLRQSQ